MIKIEFFKKNSNVFILKDLTVLECKISDIDIRVSGQDTKITYTLEPLDDTKSSNYLLKMDSELVFESKETLKVELDKQFS